MKKVMVWFVTGLSGWAGILAGQEVSVTGFRMTNLSDHGVAFEWVTEPASTCVLRYGTESERLFNQAISIGPVKEHRIRLSGLEAGTTYYYVLQVTVPRSGGTKTYEGPTGTFTTTGLPPLRVLSVSVESNIGNRFVVVWRLTRPAKATVHYVEDGRTDRRTVSSAVPAREGRLAVTGLKPGAAYFYVTEFEADSGESARDEVRRIRVEEVNLAAGRPVWGTFTNVMAEDPYFDRTTPVAARITDGSLTWFWGTAVSGDLSQADQWCAVDLGEVRRVSQVEVIWRRLSLSTNFRVEVSTDGSRWTVVAERLDGRKGVEGRGERGDPYRALRVGFPPREARWVKVTALKGSAKNKHERWTGVQLMELRVFE